LEDDVEHEVQKSRTQVERANEASVDKFLPWFQRFIFPLPFAMKIIKINLWNQGNKFLENLPNFHCFLLIILSTKICNCSFVYISHTI
jgi:hypothetical protein